MLSRRIHNAEERCIGARFGAGDRSRRQTHNLRVTNAEGNLANHLDPWGSCRWNRPPAPRRRRLDRNRRSDERRSPDREIPNWKLPGIPLLEHGGKDPVHRIFRRRNISESLPWNLSGSTFPGISKRQFPPIPPRAGRLRSTLSTGNAFSKLLSELILAAAPITTANPLETIPLRSPFYFPTPTRGIPASHIGPVFGIFLYSSSVKPMRLRIVR